MRNLMAKYILTDGIDASKVVLLLNHHLETTLFVCQNIVDSRIIPVYPSIWKKWKFLIKIKPVETLLSVSDNGMPRILEPNEVSNVTKQKIKRAKILASGYSKLLWCANRLTEVSWGTSSISYSDLLFLLLDGSKLTSFYATSKDIPIDQAIKQIEIDKQSLLTRAIRRKEILWTYEKSLLEVTNNEELVSWERKMIDDVVKVGSA